METSLDEYRCMDKDSTQGTYENEETCDRVEVRDIEETCNGEETCNHGEICVSRKTCHSEENHNHGGTCDHEETCNCGGICDNAESVDNLPLVLYLQEHLNLRAIDLRSFSPLTLAYIGDCIYELVIRTMLVEQGNAPVNKLHKRASNLVKASAQKDIFHKIEPLLTQQEISIYKRGRNAKSFTSAKNATIGEYRIATGFEALMGYLYLNNQMNRMVELIKKGLEKE